MLSITSRLRPFSHQPKTECLIPGTEILVEAYPSLIRLKDFNGKVFKEISLVIEGPLKQFTVMQDLERGCVTVFSEQYRFHVLPDGELSYAKNPGLPSLSNREKLSLGSHKKQEWEGIKKRGDFREIFPIWFRLGSLLNLPKRKEANTGIFSLIKKCHDVIESHQPEMILPAFNNLFLTGFHDIMVPRLWDDDFHGILPSDAPLAKGSPLYLLSEGAALIRSLFFVSSDNELAILPNLPPQFFAGRILNLKCPPYGELDLEWSKKVIRRLEFRAHRDGEIYFHFRSPLRSYRVRQSKHEKGRMYACGDSLKVRPGMCYFLDRFQK